MLNWRDYGGYRSSLGGHVARDRLFRCAAPVRLSTSERHRIEALSLAAVIDLRGAAERSDGPTFWPGFDVPVFSVDPNTDGQLQLLGNGSSGPYDAAIAHKVMLAAYAEMPYRPTLLPAYRMYFQALAGAQGPTLVHCFAGKDRTGLAVALLQHLLGVHVDDIMSEYLRTNETGNSALSELVLEQHLRAKSSITLTPEGLCVFSSVSPDYLRTAFEVIGARSGSIDAYLQDVIEVTPEARSVIHRRLLIG